MPKIKTTKSSKRYAFSSFRERVDAIKIEPSKKLNRKAFDDAETSHFISSYERWSEINRSAVFTDFVENVAPFCQSLPQILHYKSKLFEELKTHISKHDHLSLQPLLELLTQFCHDLGPDFMEFYDESLKLITSLALDQNDSNTLEWEFNSLAYIFKYLSRYLSQDLIPTFQLLEPLLKSKDHISRFSSEALAFLVRKTSQEELAKVATFVFEHIFDLQYKRAAIILFSESMKSTKGSIHSKSSLIIRTLLANVDSDASSVVVGDVLLSVISYGSQEAVETLHEIVLKESTNKLDADGSYLQFHLRILTTLIFADSGKKVPNWESISSCIESTFEKFPPKEMNNDSKCLLTYLIAIFFRNSEIKVLTKLHSFLLRSMITLDNLFLPFIMQIFNLSKQRAIKFSVPYIQEFINKHWKSNVQQIAYFLEDLEEKELLGETNDDEKIALIVPLNVAENLKEDLLNLNVGDVSLFEIFWRLSLISHSSFYNKSFVSELFTKIDQSVELSTFKQTVLSKLIGLFALEDANEVHELILDNFSKLVTNKEFIKNASKFLVSSIKSLDSNTVFELIDLLTHNLALPDHEIRANSLELINALSQTLDEELSNLANQCLIIEQIPLVLDTARDIAIRTRNLAAYFKNTKTNEFKNKVYFRFLFGLLTVKFAPSWEAVFEVLPNTYQKSPELVWELVVRYLNRPKLDKDSISNTLDEVEDLDFAQQWSSIETRLVSIIGHLTTSINKYTNSQTSLMELVVQQYPALKYPEIAAAHAVKVLKKIPQLAEKNAAYLASIVLNDQIEDDQDNEEDEGEEDLEFGKMNLNRQDGNAVLELFSLFKRLKDSPRADELYELFLRLLSSKTPAVRKIALSCLLNFKFEQINKYKDNLNNLLDDSLFRDEVSNIFSRGDSSVLEESDLDRVFPLILRILYARAQITVTNGTKRGLKFSAINTLPNIQPKYVDLFLGYLSEKVYGGNELIEVDEKALSEVTISSLKRAQGFSNLLFDILSSLGEKFVANTSNVITPLINSLMLAQNVIDDSQDQQLAASARNTRQSGMKSLLLLFNLANDFNWDDYIESIYEKVLAPRFVHFEGENLQQPSSLLRLMICWSEHPNYHELLLINQNEPAIKVLSLLGNKNAKGEVLEKVLDFAVNIISSVPQKRKFQKLFSIVSESAFENIPSILSRIFDQKLYTKAIGLLLALVENKHVQDQNKRQKLVDFSTKLLEKPSVNLPKDIRHQILRILQALVDEFDGEFEDIVNLFKVCSKFLKIFTEKEQRVHLVDLFVKIGEKFEQLQHVTSLIADLSSYSNKRLNEYDYDRRLAAYKKINDAGYLELSSLEWTPILNLMLYAVKDEDLSVRSNSSYSLRRFIDIFTVEKKERDATFNLLLKDLLLPNLRTGLRAKDENVHFEFVSLLSHIVNNSEYFDGFKDLQVLLFNNDEEANFFINVGHIQLHRRQRAIKRLGEFANKLSSSNISHYLLPMIERYAFYEDEKLRNISNETVSTIESLMKYVTFKQYQAIFRRYLSGLKDESDHLRDSVSLIVTVSKALMNVVLEKRESDDESILSGLPKEEASLDNLIETELIGPLSKILNKRNDETIVLRTPLIEALSCLVLCLSHERIVAVLPGVLTNVCQVMRAKSDETRDATRKHIGKAASILGARYVKFIINELKTALSRGSQIHVLGFTVHSILASMNLDHGDLDESSEILMEIVMENMFGSTGQEKEADNYRTTMKEIKFNKSFDIAEILSRVVSLSRFNTIVNPIKLLLRERITFKVQNKLDELIRRISLGTYKNSELSSHSMLVLCYELFSESKKVYDGSYKTPAKASNKDEGHFLVQLESKPLKVETENSLFIDTFQKLSLDLLRTTLSKNDTFVNAESLAGFLPFFEDALKSDNEGVIISTLRVLGLIMDVPFETESDIFKSCARRCLSIIKNYPSTESELCQACYKYLSNIIRHREDLSLKESSLGYLLVRIQPDLQEQSRQGMAFNFLKALVAKHVMIPEVYDTMDKIREVMVTSHSKERRDMSRSIYFQFIMEYDQGKGRLEKQFKFLVNNLSYPAETGKQSVMELIHLILQKSGRELLEALSSSFFVALAKVLISETSTKTREMSIALISSIFEKMGTEPYERYILGWLNSQNSSLLRCSLQLYRIKLKVNSLFGNELDDAVIASIKSILESSEANSVETVKWELVYSSLSCLPLVVEKDINVFEKDMVSNIINCLLFPHSWIRLASSRLVGVLMKKSSLLSSDDIQNVAYRLVHQLRAPSVDEALGSQVVKNLTHCVIYWEKNDVVFNKGLVKNQQDELEEEEEEEEEADVVSKADQKMDSWLINKVGGIIRSDRLSFVSKKSCVQLLALMIQLMKADRLKEVTENLISPLFNLTEFDTDDVQKQELQTLALECLKMIEDKVGVTDYTQAYSNVRQSVLERRQERRTKRARLAITAPEAVARRKIKKHERSRVKRKHEKDENGYYHTKKKTQRRN